MLPGHPFAGQPFEGSQLMFLQTAGIATDIRDSHSLRNKYPICQDIPINTRMRWLNAKV